MGSKVESEFRKFENVFVKHPQVHCDPKRKDDVVASVFCQLNGKPIEDILLTCCPKNKLHYLVNCKNGTDEKIKEIQNVLNKVVKNCPTCKKLNAVSPLKAERDENVQKEVHAYYDEKYEAFKKEGFTSRISLQILKEPAVPCKNHMHGFVDLNEVEKIDKCPACSGDQPFLVKKHSFLDYAVQRWLKTDEGKKAYQEQEANNSAAAARQAKASTSPSIKRRSLPTKPGSVNITHPVVPKRDPSSIRLKGLKRICSSSIKLILCIGLIVLIGMLYVRYKDHIFNYKLVR